MTGDLIKGSTLADATNVGLGSHMIRTPHRKFAPRLLAESVALKSPEVSHNNHTLSSATPLSAVFLVSTIHSRNNTMAEIKRKTSGESRLLENLTKYLRYANILSSREILFGPIYYDKNPYRGPLKWHNFAILSLLSVEHPFANIKHC